MASKGALVLPAGVALLIEEGALSIHHQGDIVIEGVPAQPLHTLTSDKGDIKLACPEEVAWRMETITAAQVRALAESYGACDYARYLLNMLEMEAR